MADVTQSSGIFRASFHFGYFIFITACCASISYCSHILERANERERERKKKEGKEN